MLLEQHDSGEFASRSFALGSSSGMIIRFPPPPIFFQAEQRSRFQDAVLLRIALSPTGSRCGFCFHRTTRGLCTSYTPCPSPPPTPISRPSRRALLRSPLGFHRRPGLPGAGWLRSSLPMLWRGASTAVSNEVMETVDERVARGLFLRGACSWVSIRSYWKAIRRGPSPWLVRERL